MSLIEAYHLLLITCRNTSYYNLFYQNNEVKTHKKRIKMRNIYCKFHKYLENILYISIMPILRGFQCLNIGFLTKEKVSKLQSLLREEEARRPNQNARAVCQTTRIIMGDDVTCHRQLSTCSVEMFKRTKVSPPKVVYKKSPSSPKKERPVLAKMARRLNRPARGLNRSIPREWRKGIAFPPSVKVFFFFFDQL